MAQTTDQIKVEILAEIGKFVADMKQASDTTKNETSKMNSTLGDLGDSWKKLGVITAQIGAIYAGLSFFRNAMAEARDYTLSIERMSIQLNISLERASALNEAMGDLLIETDTISAATAKLTTEMRSGNPAFASLGVAIKDANGNYRSQFDVLMDVIDSINQSSNATERSVKFNELFGRSSQSLQPILRLTKERLDEATQEVIKYDRVVTEDAVVATRAFEEAWGDLGDRVSDTTKKIGDATKALLIFITNKPGNIFDFLAGGDIFYAKFALFMQGITDKTKDATQATKALTAEQIKLKEAADAAASKEKSDEADKAFKDAAAVVTAAQAIKDSWNFADLPPISDLFKIDVDGIYQATEALGIFNAKRLEYDEQNKASIKTLEADIALQTQVFTALTQGFTSAIQGLITGTMSFKTAFQTIMRSAIMSVIQLFVQMGLQYVLSSMLSKKVAQLEALTKIGAAAAVAGATAYAALAWNPPLAEIAAAAAYGRALAFGSTLGATSAEGGWGYVPMDGALASLHKGEMVLPASIADSVRDMTSGGGSGGGINNFYIQAMDSMSFDSYVKNNAQTILQAQQLAIRNGGMF